MIYLKTPEELEKMRNACALVSATLGEIARWVAPGVTTNKLESIAREFIHDNGGKAACLGYGGFPAAVCWEINETVVHGFPSNYVLREGDILGADTVVELDGFNGDMCYTFPVGEISDEIYQLCRTTKESLYKGIEACKEGNRIGDIANAVQTYCERRGYSVVREMCGHGIGRKMHEDPEVPNYGRRGTGIERDGWTCRTRDRKPSAHYEHTLCVVGGRPEILTSYDPIHEVLQERFI